MKADIYQRITDQIVRELESGVRPWIKPWNAGNGSGRITRPLRASINVLVLWSEAITKGYQSPVWMTFKQAEDLLRKNWYLVEKVAAALLERRELSRAELLELVVT